MSDWFYTIDIGPWETHACHMHVCLLPWAGWHNEKTTPHTYNNMLVGDQTKQVNSKSLDQNSGDKVSGSWELIQPIGAGWLVQKVTVACSLLYKHRRVRNFFEIPTG